MSQADGISKETIERPSRTEQLVRRVMQKEECKSYTIRFISPQLAIDPLLINCTIGEIMDWVAEMEAGENPMHLEVIDNCERTVIYESPC